MVYWLHTDHLGSTSEATTGTGGISARQRYAPYGRVRYAYGTMPTSYNYTGQRLDGTGLLYYGARYYDPRLARFVQADTLVPQPGNPQALNRFAYVLNNPLKYTDPTGHCAQSDPDFRQCLDQMTWLYHEFGIYFTGDWKLQELLEVMEAFNDVVLAFADAHGQPGNIAFGRGLFREVWAGTFMNRVHSVGSNPAITGPSGTIDFYDNWTSGLGGAKGTVVHELAHAWDIQGGSLFGDPYADPNLFLGFGIPLGVGAESGAMMHAIGARAECGFAFNCASLPNNPGTGEYFPGPENPYSWYGNKGPGEDWAEAFRGWVYDRPNLQANNPMRANFVQLQVSQLTAIRPPLPTWNYVPIP